MKVSQLLTSSVIQVTSVAHGGRLAVHLGPGENLRVAHSVSVFPILAVDNPSNLGALSEASCVSPNVGQEDLKAKKSMRKKDASPYPSSSHLLGHDRVHHGCARRVPVHAIRGARWPGDIVDSSNGIPHHLRRSWVEIVERANLDQLDGLLDLKKIL